MKMNKPIDPQDSGNILSQKTNEDFNKKKPVQSEFTKSKNYQKDKIHAEPSNENMQTGKNDEMNKDTASKKTHEFTGEEFIDKK